MAQLEISAAVVECPESSLELLGVVELRTDDDMFRVMVSQLRTETRSKQLQRSTAPACSNLIIVDTMALVSIEEARNY